MKEAASVLNALRKKNPFFRTQKGLLFLHVRAKDLGCD